MEVSLMRHSLLWLIVVALLLGLFVPALAGDDVYVNGYYRRDGTYVQPHMRSAPDSSYNNNWSTSPNVNPHTGQQGTNPPKLYDYNSGSGLGGDTFGTQPRSRSRW
jgi:hypothetical protein